MSYTIQTCPVCKGTGLVSFPKGVAGDTPYFAYSSSGPWTCHSCQGTGVLYQIEIEQNTLCEKCGGFRSNGQCPTCKINELEKTNEELTNLLKQYFDVYEGVYDKVVYNITKQKPQTYQSDEAKAVEALTKKRLEEVPTHKDTKYYATPYTCKHCGAPMIECVGDEGESVDGLACSSCDVDVNVSLGVRVQTLENKLKYVHDLAYDDSFNTDDEWNNNVRALFGKIRVALADKGETHDNKK